MHWGKLPFEHLFEPAIRYAKQGFSVSPETARAWQNTASKFLSQRSELFSPFQEISFPGGRAPQTGEIWGSPTHAVTLREIAATGGESFYHGPLAEQIAAWAEKTKGLITLEDLKAHQSGWVQPISTTYRDLTLWEMPPNGQGIAALIGLNILERFDVSAYPRDSAESFHLQVEAMKLGLADACQHVSDPASMLISSEQLLDKTRAAQLRALIGDEAIIVSSDLRTGGTVYLAAVDEGLMVSFIQSNYHGFGSGVLIPGTGIALQNRGCGFTLQAGHPNILAPGKRPFHTIIPAFLTEGDVLLGPMGVMGAHMQPQGHLQMVVNLQDHGMNPQAALDAPRWQVTTGKTVFSEQTVPRSIALALAKRGYEVQVLAEGYSFGKGQMILRQNGV